MEAHRTSDIRNLTGVEGGRDRAESSPLRCRAPLSHSDNRSIRFRTTLRAHDLLG